MSRIFIRQGVSIALCLSLVSQSLAPLAYSQQGGSGPEQPTTIVTLPGSDPQDTIVPDTINDVPIPYPNPGELSHDLNREDWWYDPDLIEFVRMIDFGAEPIYIAPPIGGGGGGTGGSTTGGGTTGGSTSGGGTAGSTTGGTTTGGSTTGGGTTTGGSTTGGSTTGTTTGGTTTGGTTTGGTTTGGTTGGLTTGGSTGGGTTGGGTTGGGTPGGGSTPPLPPGTPPGEKGGGSIFGGGSLINPPPSPPPGSGGGGGLDVTGHLNTNTGLVDLAVPIVSFNGVGEADINLSMSLKQFVAHNEFLPITQIWKDNYYVRFDLDAAKGLAVVTMADGLSMPFKRVGPANNLGNEPWISPNGIRAKLINLNGLGYQLQWRNGDVWFFGGSSFHARYVTSFQFKTGGSIGCNRTSNSTRISSGWREVLIQYPGSGLPSNVGVRITAPNGVTEIRNEQLGHGMNFPTTVVFPNNSKTVKFLVSPIVQRVWPGAITANGYRVGGYIDAKGGTYGYAFDGLGRLSWVQNPQQKRVSYDYSTPGRTKITNEDGKVSYDLYAAGQYVGHQDEAGFTTVLTRNGDHDITSYRNQRGQTWTINRNSFGDALSVTNPMNQTTTMTYNSKGQVLSRTNVASPHFLTSLYP